MGAATPLEPDACGSRSAISRHRELLAIAVMAGAMLVVWILQHGYAGLVHDSRLYMLQALARLEPGLLGNDLFLRYGSQDSFTLFSPLFAAAISAFGVEQAAAAVTLASHLAFFAAAWMLARALMPARQAWLAVMLLAALRSGYGAGDIFYYVEPFLTPRMMAEAMVIAALAALVRQRHALAAGFMVAGVLLHPLMAAAGIAAGCFLLAIRRGIRLAWVAGALLIGALAFAAVVHTSPDARLDGPWREYLATMTPYLFLSSWHAGDWVKAGLRAAALCVGLIVLAPTLARDLCKVALLTAGTGIALGAIGSDVLGLVLVVQAQPWRWLWIAAFAAVLLSPVIAHRCWQLGGAGRAAILMLASAWLSAREPYAAPFAATAIALAVWSRSGGGAWKKYQRVVVIGAAAVFVISLVLALANNILVAHATPKQGGAPALVRFVRTLFDDGGLAALAVVAVWWSASVRATPARLWVCGSIVATALAVLMPVCVSEWTRVSLGRKAYEAFEPWRALIPPGTEVLWVDGITSNWLLLKRPSYLSNAQMATALFSRPATVELQRRSVMLAPFLAREPIARWPREPKLASRATAPSPSLEQLCASSEVRFVVTRRDMRAMPLADVPPAAPAGYRGLKLYGCDRK